MVLVGCGDNGNQSSSEHKNEDHVKELLKGEVIHQDVKLDVSSKFMKGDMYLKFKLYPYSKGSLKGIFLNQDTRKHAQVKVSLRDADNFELKKLSIELNDFKYNNDNDVGEHLELDYKISLFIDEYMYRKIKSARVQQHLWALDIRYVPNGYSNLVPNP